MWFPLTKSAKDIRKTENQEPGKRPTFEYKGKSQLKSCFATNTDTEMD